MNDHDMMEATDLSINGISTMPEPQDEDEAEAERQLLASFASASEAEKTQVAAVTISRYKDIPERDADGKLVRDDETHKVVKGPLTLYFQRLLPGTTARLYAKYTRSVSVKREDGRTVREDRLDSEGFGLDVVYTALMPWCRKRYFDNQALWQVTKDPIGTGRDFVQYRLNSGEIATCATAVMQLEGMGDEEAAVILGKH